MPVRVPLTASGPLTEATFLARPNQLLVEARLAGRVVRAHMADRGRLLDLLTPGARLLLAPRDEIGRKTSYQVVGVYSGDELVSLDTQLPNRLMVAAFAAGALPQFARYTKLQREVMVGAHRFDFRLGEGLTTCVVEVKSVGKVEDGIARFPDAPTERGRQHLEVLAQMARSGQRCAVVFIIQRHRARALVPDDGVDPAFARALRAAIAAGVETYAYLCPLTPDGLALGP
ncbi:MAG TPA: DNA/RNA nuclease SfsA, partial [Chloroflexaceae bacterium]|nr:DNA/RNA nuclease SfsA [Chloroflexaceae bacterium]